MPPQKLQNPASTQWQSYDQLYQSESMTEHLVILYIKNYYCALVKHYCIASFHLLQNSVPEDIHPGTASKTDG